MDHTGDTRHQFDSAALKQVEQAEERFKQLTGHGFTAATRLGEGELRVLKKPSIRRLRRRCSYPA
jgi:hypothetical protein